MFMLMKFQVLVVSMLMVLTIMFVLQRMVMLMFRVLMPMMRFTPVMVVAFFLFSVHRHRNMRSRNAAFDGRFSCEAYARDTQGIQLRYHFFRLRT